MKNNYSTYKPINLSELDDDFFNYQRVSNPEINTFSDYTKPQAKSYNVTFDYTPLEKKEEKQNITTKEEIKTPKVIDDKKVNLIKPIVSKTTSTKDFSKYKNKAAFDAAMDEAIKENPEIAKRREFLTRIAAAESGFNHTIQNKQGAPAYGLFQFMQGSAKGRSWNNIDKYAGVSIDEFRNNPKIQILAANKLADSFLAGMSEDDRKKAKEQGYTDNAILAGAWLGGNGGVRKALAGVDLDDKGWSKDGKTGTTVLTRMREFNFD
jgi:hypothetical protein